MKKVRLLDVLLLFIMVCAASDIIHGVSIKKTTKEELIEIYDTYLQEPDSVFRGGLCEIYWEKVPRQKIPFFESLKK